MGQYRCYHRLIKETPTRAGIRNRIFYICEALCRKENAA